MRVQESRAAGTDQEAVGAGTDEKALAAAGTVEPQNSGTFGALLKATMGQKKKI